MNQATETVAHACFASNKEIVLTEKELASFWSKVTKSDGCWIWNGYKNQDGYGRMVVNERLVMTHRIAFAIHHEQPLKRLILHSCDNPACVNPSHLSVGSQKENVADMDAKRRRYISKGEEIHCAKLTDEMVLKIRHLKEASNIRVAAISRMFNVSHRTIRLVILRETWKHV